MSRDTSNRFLARATSLRRYRSPRSGCFPLMGPSIQPLDVRPHGWGATCAWRLCAAAGRTDRASRARPTQTPESDDLSRPALSSSDAPSRWRLRRAGRSSLILRSPYPAGGGEQTRRPDSNRGPLHCEGRAYPGGCGSFAGLAGRTARFGQPLRVSKRREFGAGAGGRVAVGRSLSCASGGELAAADIGREKMARGVDFGRPRSTCG